MTWRAAGCRQGAHKGIVELLKREGKEREARKARDVLGQTPKDLAEAERQQVVDRKKEIWGELVVKQRQFLKVPHPYIIYIDIML